MDERVESASPARLVLRLALAAGALLAVAVSFGAGYVLARRKADGEHREELVRLAAEARATEKRHRETEKRHGEEVARLRAESSVVTEQLQDTRAWLLRERKRTAELLNIVRTQQAQAKKVAREKAKIKAMADRARARADWVQAEKLYTRLASLARSDREKATVLDYANYCGAMRLYELALKAENEGRCAEAIKLLEEAAKNKNMGLFRAALERVKGRLRSEESSTQDSGRFEELVARARELEARDELAKAVACLKATVKLKVPGEKLTVVVRELRRLVRELTYRECVGEAEAALAADEPDYALAAEELTKAKALKGELPPELAEKLAECRRRAERAPEEIIDAAQLDARWKDLMREWRKVARAPREAFELLSGAEETFAGSGHAEDLARLRDKAKGQLERAAETEWVLVRKRVGRHPDDHAANVELLEKCLEKVRGLEKHEQLVSAALEKERAALGGSW